MSDNVCLDKYTSFHPSVISSQVLVMANPHLHRAFKSFVGS